jgi:sn-glycerol 3-phosphate transport system ATP-binding protein
MVFQNYALYPHMSVFDNMAYGLKIARVPRDEISLRVRRAAAILEIEAFLDRKPRQLSGGQRQRVAMGRAIVREPQVFLFDEPLSNLDARLRAQTRVEIRKLHAELGVTSLFVTHDQVEAMTLAQRVIVMNAGLIEQIGTPETIYRAPESTFVASFIGAPPMNLMPVRAEGSRLVRESFELDLPADVPRDGELIMGVRPEHARFDDHGWPMTVELVELLGAERLIHGRLADAPFIVRTDARLASPSPGQIVGLQIAPESLHWFDPTTQKRLPT